MKVGAHGCGLDLLEKRCRASIRIRSWRSTARSSRSLRGTERLGDILEKAKAQMEIVAQREGPQGYSLAAT